MPTQCTLTQQLQVALMTASRASVSSAQCWRLQVHLSPPCSIVKSTTASQVLVKARLTSLAIRPWLYYRARISTPCAMDLVQHFGTSGPRLRMPNLASNSLPVTPMSNKLGVKPMTGSSALNYNAALLQEKDLSCVSSPRVQRISRWFGTEMLIHLLG
ncbi:unannotated protein [freshwater metagenome]|uniref:Unannotated protein n=1 Tax=freshwater metagenome TaxID=449393 RepID=A0A6J7GZH4_9ZZZZ